jgi:hypothetical protein
MPKLPLQNQRFEFSIWLCGYLIFVAQKPRNLHCFTKSSRIKKDIFLLRIQNLDWSLAASILTPET